MLSAVIEDMYKEQSCSGLGAQVLVYYGAVSASKYELFMLSCVTAASIVLPL